MEKPNQFTVKLKLKNHKLLSSDMPDGSLKIGGIQKVVPQIMLWIVLPIVMSGIMFAMYFLIGFSSGVFYSFFLFIGVLTLIFAGTQGVLLQRKIKSSGNHKIIKSGELYLGPETDKEIILKGSNIKEINYSVAETNREVYEGELFVMDQNLKTYNLLTIFGSDRKYLKEDLDYFKRFVELKLEEA